METAKKTSWVDQTVDQIRDRLRDFYKQASQQSNGWQAERELLEHVRAKFIESYRNGAQAERNRQKGICQPADHKTSKAATPLHIRAKLIGRYSTVQEAREAARRYQKRGA